MTDPSADHDVSPYNAHVCFLRVTNQEASRKLRNVSDSNAPAAKQTEIPRDLPWLDRIISRTGIETSDLFRLNTYSTYFCGLSELIDLSKYRLSDQPQKSKLVSGGSIPQTHHVFLSKVFAIAVDS